MRTGREGFAAPQGASRPAERPPVVLTLRGSDEWRAWLNRLGRHCRMRTPAIVDQALMEFAKSRDFREPPPAR